MHASLPADGADDATLDERTVDPDPLVQFRRWYERAGRAVAAPEAMALATADAAGRPSVRMVLLKSWGEDGFVFYTNYDGRKSRDLEANPEAALLFYWEPLGRQVRIEGSVTRTGDAEADAVLRQPRGRPAGSAPTPPTRAARSPAGPSSTPRRPSGRPTSPTATCPARRGGAVGGWRRGPSSSGSWGADRMHDRVAYEPSGPGWSVHRLQP